MKYKKSKYNFTYSRNEGEVVVYNTYSKAVVLLNKEEYKQYNDLNFEDEHIEKELKDNGILVDEMFDENRFLSYCHYRTKFAHESLHMILAITMDCNFACPYCYENRRTGKMSNEIQDKIIDFIDKKIKDGTNNLDITWYGGEPLLYPDIIRDMSIKLLNLTKEKQCKLTMYMVTNGYLLTEKVIQMLDEIGIAKVQITLDGMKENHDLRRPLRGGNGTFEKIYNNLKLFEDVPIRVDIRMNVDAKNCKDYILLQEKIKQLNNPNIILYPSPVEDINRDVVNEVSEFMTYDQFEKFVNDISTCGDISGAETKVLNDRYCYCQAEVENNLVIDERGDVYKCWDIVGREEYKCFNIKHPELKNYNNIIRFLGWHPFEDEKCSNCVFLPVCFGGCKFHRMNTGQYDCGFTEATMKNYIERTFFQGGEINDTYTKSKN